MSVYGLRLHVVEAYPGRSFGTPCTFNREVQSMAQALYEDLSAIQGQVFVRSAAYTPKNPEVAEAELAARTPVMRLDRLERVGDRVEATVAYGLVGDHAFLLDPGGAADTPIKGAPARFYSVVFYCATAGSRGVMASGTTGRTFTGELLLKRVSVEASKRAEASGADEPWRRWSPKVLTDKARINEVVEKGALEGIRLQRSQYDEAGNLLHRPITLTQNGTLVSQKGKIRTLLTRWVSAAAEGRSLSKSDEVAALVELVDGDVSGMEFTDGKISFSENGKVQTVSPSTLNNILIYPISDTPLTLEQLRSNASKRIRPLVPIEKLAVALDPE